MTTRASDIESMSALEVRNVSVDMQGKLDEGETLTGTPTVTEATGDIALSNKQVNTSALTINDVAVAIGEAIQFTADPADDAEGVYTIYFSCGTSEGQTVDGELLLRIC